MANEKPKDEDAAGPNARLGSVIKGKWTIDSLLGVGGMAAVYAASHRNGQRAALKILHVEFSHDKAICERFLREAYVSNKVNDGATVQVLDDDVTEQGEPFLIMELLEGETVRDAWKKSGRTMPVGKVLQICERILDCLASCHAIKVIHRDLKPANIFILRDGEIRVLDFGVAQLRDATSERTAAGTALGTPAYMSPEQAMGLVDQLDGRADLFSVGAMMHALATGHRINSGRTEQEALVMAATKPVPSVARIAPKLPLELIKVIDKSLSWDRRSRYQDAREMQRALLELMPASGVTPLLGRPPPRPLEVVAPPLLPSATKATPAPEAPSPVAPAPASSAAPLREAAALDAPPQRPVPRAIPLSGMPPVRASLGAMGAVEVPPDASQSPPKPSIDPLFGSFAPPAPSIAPVASSSSTGSEQPPADLRVTALRDLMRHFDRLFPSVRQLGWAHPATDRALRTAYEAFTEALRRDPSLVGWTLRPYSFMALGQTVWEPGAPFDAIPYNLFACGIRELRIDAGVTFEEMRDLVALCLLDPGRDLPPEDDLAAALWEKAMPHVRWECVDAFAEGDAAEREAFYGEADHLAGLAEAATRSELDRLEMQAMALSTDVAALSRQKERSPFALDDAERRRLAPQFELGHDAWGERFVDALVEGYLDSVTNRDAPLVLASLRRSAADLVVAGRLSVAVRLHHAVVARLFARVDDAESRTKLASALTNAMFGGDTLAISLRSLREDPAALEPFASILPVLPPSELPVVLGNLREATPPALRNLLASFVERHAHGREGELGQAAIGADADAVAYLVQLVARMGTPSGRRVLDRLAQQGDDMNACVEARLLLSPSADHAAKELGVLLENPSAIVRMAALRASIRHGIRDLWPSVARGVGAKHFNDLGSDERRELLRACVALSPERGEPMLLELAKKGGVLSSAERETSRTVAAELLGELSQTRSTAITLQELAGARWGASDETKAAAASAAKKIGLRLSQSQGSVTT